MNLLMNLILNLTQMTFRPFNIMKKCLIFGIMAIIASYSSASLAVLTIEVNKGDVVGIPIAIVPFSMEGISPDEFQPADIIEGDLSFSGRFDSILRSNFLSTPNDLQSVQFKDWRLIKAEALVVGKVINLGNSQYEVRFRLIDVFREKQLSGQRFVVPASRMRKVAHQISDIIYKQLTGKDGAFDTKNFICNCERATAKSAVSLAGCGCRWLGGQNYSGVQRAHSVTFVVP